MVASAYRYREPLSTVVGAKSTCSPALTGIAGIVGPVPQEPRVLNAGPARPWPGCHHALFVRRKGAGPGTAVAAGVHHTPRTVNFCEAGNGAAGDKQARRDETGTHHSWSLGCFCIAHVNGPAEHPGEGVGLSASGFIEERALGAADVTLRRASAESISAHGR